MDRLKTLSTQVTHQNTSGSSRTNNLPWPNKDDVVICAALRTPLTKAKRGLLKDTPPEILLTTVFKGVIEKSKIDPKLI